MKHYLLPIIFALLVLACVLELVERSSIKPRIFQPFEFEELTVSSFDEVPDVDSLFDQKISMGWNGKTIFLLKALLFSGLSGAGDGTRTRNLLITNQLLYQLSYAGKNTCVIDNDRV